MTDWTHLLKHASPDVQELNADVLDGKRKPQHVQHSASVLAFPRAKRRKQRMRRR